MEDKSEASCRSQVRLGGVFVFILLLNFQCIAQAPIAANSDDQAQPKIAFAYSPNYKRPFDIFMVNADGSRLVQLTKDSKLYSRWNCCPAWSPDGTELAFISRNAWPALGVSNSGIYIMNVSSGSVRMVLRENILCLSDPAWSPDGKSLVFARDKQTSTSRWTPRTKGPLCTRYQLYSINVDGSGLRRLTQDSDVYNKRPAWSPDGKTIAFESSPVSKRKSKADIFIMAADGSGAHALTRGGPNENNSGPTWSPDGTRIAFSSNRDGTPEIYVMSRDGSEVRQLTKGSKVGCHHPTWSADGVQIAFQQSNGIYIIGADGSNLRVVSKVGWYPALGAGTPPRGCPGGVEKQFSP